MTLLKPWLLFLGLLILGLGSAYYPALQAQFIFDDDLHLVQDSLMLEQDAHYRIWFEHSKGGWAYWPVSRSFLTLQRTLWGLNPFGFHLVSILLHGLTVLVLAIWVKQIFKQGAFWTALVYAFHPLQVESVAWVTQQKGLLSCLWGVLACLTFTQWIVARQRRYYWLTVFCYFLALFSKSAIIMLPIIGAWWLYRQKNRQLFKVILYSAPFFGLSLIKAYTEITADSAHVMISDFSVAQRILLSTQTPWFYLRQFFFPFHLQFIYPPWEIDLSQLVAYLPLLLTLLICILGWHYRKSWGRLFLFCFFSYVILLFPVIGWFSFGGQQYSLVADHWVLIAQLPLVIGVGQVMGVGLGQVLSKLPQKLTPILSSILAKYTLPLLQIILLGVALFLTWRQVPMYKNREILWQTTLQSNPQAWVAHGNYANLLLEQGHLAEALSHCNQALAINALLPEVLNTRGLVHNSLNQYAAAVQDFTAALKLNPHYAAAWNNRGISHERLQNQVAAREDFTQAIKILPKAEYYLNRAYLFYAMDNLESSLSDIQQALSSTPTSSAYLLRGLLEIKQAKFEFALNDFNAAIQTAQNSTEFINAYNNRAVLYWKIKKDALSACKDWGRACEFKDCAALQKMKQQGYCP